MKDTEIRLSNPDSSPILTPSPFLSPGLKVHIPHMMHFVRLLCALFHFKSELYRSSGSVVGPVGVPYTIKKVYIDESDHNSCR